MQESRYGSDLNFRLNPGISFSFKLGSSGIFILKYDGISQSGVDQNSLKKVSGHF